MVPPGDNIHEYLPSHPSRKVRSGCGHDFHSGGGPVKLGGVSVPFSIPPLPPGWPYALREAPGDLNAFPESSIDGLGSGWTLHLRARTPLDDAGRQLPQAFGRGGILRIGEVVVRPYRRGGLVRHVNERIYASPVRFAREFAVHQALWVSGFPTVEPLGYGYRRRLWGVEGVFLTRFAAAEAWPRCWERSVDILPQVAMQLRALAAWGLLAPDLNATNLMVTADDRVLALDWDRARWARGESLIARYRERLERSLRKLQAPRDVLEAFSRSLAG